MKLHPKRKLLDEVYVRDFGRGIIVEHCVASTLEPPMYKVKLRDGTVIGWVQERHFGVVAQYNIPRLVVDHG